MTYRRIASTDVQARLAKHGAVLIEGAKAVGKPITSANARHWPAWCTT